MQRTESELVERYTSRVQGISERWFFARLRWARGSKADRVRCDIAAATHVNVLRNLNGLTEFWFAACKALGHGPRRES